MEHSAAEGQVKLTSNSYWDEPKDCTPQSIGLSTLSSPDTPDRGCLESLARDHGIIVPDCTFQNQTDPTKRFLLSLIWGFRTLRGFLYDISERIGTVAAAHGDTCEFTLDSIEKKILQGEVNNFDSFMANIRSLLAIYILGRPKNYHLLPKLMEFQKYLKAAVEPKDLTPFAFSWLYTFNP